MARLGCPQAQPSCFGWLSLVPVRAGSAAAGAGEFCARGVLFNAIPVGAQSSLIRA